MGEGWTESLGLKKKRISHFSLGAKLHHLFVGLDFRNHNLALVNP